jgi:HEAT repeat protein
MTTRLIAYHLERLKNNLAQTRLDAINELRLLGDARALEALEHLYRTDPDEEVRKAAQNAGREIFMKSHQKS